MATAATAQKLKKRKSKNHPRGAYRLVAGMLGMLLVTIIGVNAASLGGLTSSNLGAADTVVASCANGGLSFDYSYGYSPTTGNYVVTGVNIHGIPITCTSETAYLTLASPGGAAPLQYGSQSISVPTTTVTLLAPLPAENASWLSVAITGTGVSAPSAPQTLSGVPGNNSATITWTAPATDGGMAITGYNVTASPGGGTCSTGPAVFTCTVSGLTNATAYTFNVSATNAIGASNPGTIGPITPPSATNLILTSVCTPIANYPAYRQWRITNPNAYPIAFNLRSQTIPLAPQIDSIAPPGQTFWLLTAAAGASVATLTPATGSTSTKASSNATC